MSTDRTRRTTTSRDAAEAAFKAVTTKPAELPPKRPTVPNAKELVSLRMNRDILDHFQEAGPGWQDRINKLPFATAKEYALNCAAMNTNIIAVREP
jgi:uncharacterized protein (DUF4415 family)